MTLISQNQIEPDPNIDLLIAALNSSGQALLNQIPTINGIVGGNIFFSGVSPIVVLTNGQQIIVSGNFGNFITNSQTGLFYPTANPNGFIASSQTGQFQPSGHYLTTIDSGNLVPKSSTGIFVAKTDTGNFVPKSDTGNFITQSDTGNFQPLGDYYLNSNPDNFFPSGNLVAGSGVSITQDGSNLVFTSSGAGGGGASLPSGAFNTIILQNTSDNGYTGLAGQRIWIDGAYAGSITVYLPNFPNDGDTLTFMDLDGEASGPYGWRTYPQTITSQNFSISDVNGGTNLSVTLSGSFQTATFIYEAINNNWWMTDSKVSAGLRKINGVTLSAGSATISSPYIYTDSYVNASHACVDTSQLGVLYVSALSNGSATITSTNPLDADTITLTIQN